MEIALIALLTFVANVVGTASGFGTATIMLPVLVLVLPPLEAIFLVSVIHWFGNVWKVTLFRSGFNARLVAWFGIPGVIAGIGGAALTTAIDTTLLLRILGTFVIGYATFMLVAPPRSTTPPHRATLVLGGTASGFFSGLVGLGGVLRGVFLSAHGLPKATYLATIGTVGLIVDSTRLFTYAVSGVTMASREWWGLLVFIPVSFIGARAAKRIVDRISQDKFRVGVAMVLFMLGAKTLLG